MPSVRKGQKIVVVMVGLPARGKSFTSRRLSRYLTWLGYPTRVFNVGMQRRAEVGAHQTHAFFDPNNKEGARTRAALAAEVLETMVSWLHGDARIAIYDATNSTSSRRESVRTRCEAEGFAVLFIELQSEDPRIVETNILANKLRSPDYEGVDADKALEDFVKRINHYRSAYEEVEDREGSYLRIIDRGRKIVMHDIDGYVPARIVFFLSNLQAVPSPIFLSRHGESEYNARGRLGGDSPLTERGRKFAGELNRFMAQRLGENAELDVWTSTMQRTRETAESLGRELAVWRPLDEIDAGRFDGMTYAEIAERWPEEFEARARNKLGYRYPRGESYEDVIQRLDRVIVELERYRTPVLIVAHQAVLRTLYSYFAEVPPAETPHLDIPLHTVIELTPTAYGCDERRTVLPPGPVDHG